MDYNQFSYYRANPYSKQGYMPPRAHLNRHRPDFLTEMPMGESDFSRFGKRIYGNVAQRSNIKQQHLFESPERYPFDNRIALDKQYQRNLNTIDIQGASSGTVMSEAVRNKLKAKQQISRRQHISQGKKQGLDRLESFDEEKRRNLAMQQYLREQQMRMTRNMGPENDQSMNREQINENENKHFSDIGNYHQKINERQINQTPPDRNNRYSQYAQEQNRIPRYQSIDSSNLPRNNPEFSPRTYNKKTQLDHQHPNLSESRYYDKNREYDMIEPKDRRDVRRQNPTNLSSEGSIYLAGRNLMNN